MTIAAPRFDPEAAAELRAPAYRRLFDAARRSLERGNRTTTIDDVTAAEAHVWSPLLRRRIDPGRRVTIDLQRLDQALRESRLGAGLREWLSAEAPLRDRPQERLERSQQREQFWAQAIAHPLAQATAIRDWLASLRRQGLLARLAPGAEAELLDDAFAVLARLVELDRDGVVPRHEPLLQAQLAAEVCGNAKALDRGQPTATVVARALALCSGIDLLGTAAGWRALWEAFGVACDDVSTTVLVLNLRLRGNTPLARRLSAARGEPQVLTLRELRRSELRLAPARLYVCENPKLLQLAADQVGADTAPLVATSGWPGLAVTTLLNAASVGGCQLWYHGDYDWPGVAIARSLFGRYQASAWCYDAAHYRYAAARAGQTGEPLSGRPEPTDWDPDLREAMLEIDRVVHEEAVVVSDLLPGLSGDQDHGSRLLRPMLRLGR